MLFNLMLKNAAPGERSIVRSFLVHLGYGYFIAVLIGAVAYTLILVGLRSQIEIPPLFALAMLAQAGIAGGLLGVAVFMTKIAQWDDEDDDDDDKGRKAPEPVTPAPVRPAYGSGSVSPSGASAAA